jgi:protein gp37
MGRLPGRWINLAGGHGFNGERVHYARKVGKKAAGRQLDGRTHDEFPA